MRLAFYVVLTIFSTLTSFSVFGQTPQNSVLRSGRWFKVAVSRHGVYKISYEQFKNMGFNPSSDPRNIQVFGLKGGMLPQSNGTQQTSDLTELAILIPGEADGVLNKEDYILFYGEGPYTADFDLERQTFKCEKNLYSEKNFYFVTVGNTNGKRIGTSENLGDAANIIQQFDDLVYDEKDEYNHLKSGREWFKPVYDNYSVSFDVEGIVENSEMKFISDVVAQSIKGSSFKIFINNTPVSEQVIPATPNTTYGIKGRHQIDTLIINSTAVASSSVVRQEFKYQFVPTSTSDKGLLNFFQLHFKRKLRLYGNQVLFRSIESLSSPTALYNIGNVTEGCSVWDVTDAYNPKKQAYSLQANVASFATSSDQLKTFSVFNTSADAPEFVGEVKNQDLHGATTPTLIVVTHPAFLAEAKRLAQHRESHNSITTFVTTTEEIYNEFSSGRQDITAIRNFIKHLYDKSPSTLQAVLLFGRGSYDYKDRVANNTNFVPTYESRNSLSPLETYSSDDYYGFMEASEGEWKESSPAQSHTIDIGIGRLPVKSLEEASAVVSKIIEYDVSKKSLGEWRKNIVFVADDGSTSDGFTKIHQEQANTMAALIEREQALFNTKKIFLGTYQKQVTGSTETIPKANDDIVRMFNKGALIINYTGHGNERQWADENIFNNTDIAGLQNKFYPFLITATCEFGRNDEPSEISGAEEIVVHKKGGAVGMVTTARPVNSNTNFSLNQAFYDALFEKEEGKYLSLGQVFRRTKNNSTSGVANRNFILLADPSQMLALPALSAIATNIKTAFGSDTLSALSTVTVKGHIEDAEGRHVSDFNGELDAVLFDKQTEFTTVGKNNPPFKYNEWYNRLFNGKASVHGGNFEFQFILPKNIAYEVDSGKLSLYATDLSRNIDASGYSHAFKVGGSEDVFANDTTSPSMRLFMGDTTFVNGGIVQPNTRLIVRLEDNSGINISNYGIGNTMVAIIDNADEAYLLNEYYKADLDTYQRGWINFPINNIPAGRHKIVVKSWDVFNNPSQASIDFTVTDGEELVIGSVGNFPNPFAEETTVFFTHNRAGDDIEVQLDLLTPSGQALQQYHFTIEESPYQVNLLKLNTLSHFGQKLPAGVYFGRLVVRSLSNGSKNERVAKLIIVN